MNRADNMLLLGRHRPRGCGSFWAARSRLLMLVGFLVAAMTRPLKAYFLQAPDDFKSSNPTVIHYNEETREFFVSVIDPKDAEELHVDVQVLLGPLEPSASETTTRPAGMGASHLNILENVQPRGNSVTILEGLDSPYGFMSFIVKIPSTQRTHLFSLYLTGGQVSGDVAPRNLHGACHYKSDDLLYVLPTLVHYFPCTNPYKPLDLPCYITFDSVKSFFFVELVPGILQDDGGGGGGVVLQAWINPRDASITELVVNNCDIESKLCHLNPQASQSVQIPYTQVIIRFPSAIWYRVFFFPNGKFIVDPDEKNISALSLFRDMSSLYAPHPLHSLSFFSCTAFLLWTII